MMYISNVNIQKMRPSCLKIPQEGAQDHGVNAGRDDRIHLPPVLGSSARGHWLSGCLMLRCCRGCPSERLEMSFPLLWVKGEEGLALGLPKL